MNESVIQTQIIEWMSLMCRSVPFLFFSVPNEGMMTAALMGSLPKSALFGMLTKFKKMGMTPGAPDIIIGCRGKIYAMEVKSESGVVSDNQSRFSKWCAMCGIPYRVVRTIGEAQDALFEWGIIGG